MGTKKAASPELLAQAIRNRHQSCKVMTYLGTKSLPDRRVARDLLQKCTEVLYPGYFCRAQQASLEQNLNDLRLGFSQLLECARIHVKDGDEYHPERILDAVMAKIPDWIGMLALDVEAAWQSDPSANDPVEIIFCYPGIFAVTAYRVAHELHLAKVPLIPRMLSEHAHSVTGIDIHPGATIGTGFFIDHGTGVVIGETCDIGNNVRIYQGVTLGALTFAKDEAGELVRHQKRHPTIEDRVVIYANATILGGETVIGQDSVIGSSVWVTSSIPPRTLVTVEAPAMRLRKSVLSTEGAL